MVQYKSKHQIQQLDQCHSQAICLCVCHKAAQFTRNCRLHKQNHTASHQLCHCYMNVAQWQMWQGTLFVFSLLTAHSGLASFHHKWKDSLLSPRHTYFVMQWTLIKAHHYLTY